MPLLDPSNPLSPPDNATQPLPTDDWQQTTSSHLDAPMASFWSMLRSPLQWPRTTQVGLAATGGALAVAVVSLAVGVLVGSGDGPRQFFGPAENAHRPNSALQIVDHNAPRTSIAPTDSDSTADDTPVAYESASVDPDQQLNREGTGLRALEPRSEDDRNRLHRRREEDRILRETRALEDKKRQIEREIEQKQLEEKRAQETRALLEARDSEDKKRLDDRLAEDKRLLDERRQAETQSVEEQQRALDDQSRKLAEANP